MAIGTQVLLALLACAPVPFQEEAGKKEPAKERPTVTVRQSAPADFVGADDVPLKAACDKLRNSGGTIVVGPGRYLIRRSIVLPANIVLRGETGETGQAETVLAM